MRIQTTNKTRTASPANAPTQMPITVPMDIEELPDEAAPAATAEDEGDGEMAALGVELTVMAPDAVGTRLIEAATASADWLARRRLPVAVMGAAGAVVAEPMPAAAATERGSSDD